MQHVVGQLLLHAQALGAHFRLPLYEIGWDEIRTQAGAYGWNVYLADMRGTSCWEVEFRPPLALIVGTFVMKGKIRISTQTEVGVSLELARVSWLSLYDVSISNPYLPQMTTIQVPMVLVNPNHSAFGFSS